MSDLPAGVGYMTLKGRIRMFRADSDDVGEQPDVGQAIATVTFTPTLGAEDLITYIDADPALSETFIATPVVCTLDPSGRITAPTDGMSMVSPSPDGTEGVRVVATEQINMMPTDWHWLISVAPIAPQTWKPFSRVWSGAPGDVEWFANLVAQTPSEGVTRGWTWYVEYVYDPDAPVLPSGFNPGYDILIDSDLNIWKVNP